jgi:hypothetical protein
MKQSLSVRDHIDRVRAIPNRVAPPPKPNDNFDIKSIFDFEVTSQLYEIALKTLTNAVDSKNGASLEK